MIQLTAPGVVVSGIDVIGTWRTTQRKGRLDVAVTPFRPFADAESTSIQDEAQHLGVVRGASQVAVR